MKTVIGFFDGDAAKRVTAELKAAGFGDILTRTKATTGTLDDLVGAGVPAAEAQLYADELARGGTLLSLETADVDAPAAIEIMKRHGVRDFRAHLTRLEEGGLIPIIEEELHTFKQEIDKGGIRVHPRLVATPVEKEVVLREERVDVDRRQVDRPATDGDYAEREIALMEHAERAIATKSARVVEEIRLGMSVTEHKEVIRGSVRHTEIDERVLPATAPPVIGDLPMIAGDPREGTIAVVEEELHVGKQRFERGGRAVRSYIVETPVEQEVSVRDEHVEVDRRRVDRPATVPDYEPKDLAMDEHSERPFVTMASRVVAEVRLYRSAEEHTEKIRDTVRHTEVDVEDDRALRGWEESSNDYRAHFEETFASAGGKWEAYEPAYRLGHEYGNGGREWSVVEGEAHARWEQMSPGTWSRAVGAVRAAFDRARAAIAPAMKRSA